MKGLSFADTCIIYAFDHQSTHGFRVDVMPGGRCVHSFICTARSTA